ncbi:MAG: helix-turn-helix transcriptional regulator [Sphaerochaetaceae bacterium]
MLAHVKMPHTTAKIRISGDGAQELLDTLKTMYDVEVEDYISATETAWYKDTKKNWTPGTEIRVQRQKRGWTQQELGKKIEVSKQVISDLENNRRSVSIKRAKALADIFKINYSKLV